METYEGNGREAVQNGLNRTMQYGNSYKNFILAFISFLFKSYYVVWKRVQRKCKKLKNKV